MSNFQVIKEFNADFEGNVYFITGDNELGKSTLLKAIGALLTGNQDAVLRNGEDKGFAKMVVGDDGEEYDVELRLQSHPRGTLSIKQKTTGMRSDNVSMLQKVFGYTDFDAVEFSRWSETAGGSPKASAIRRALLPENVQKRIAEIDAEVITVKEKRKDANAEVKTYTTTCAAAEKQLKPGDVKTYAEKIDIADLMEEQNENARLIEKAKTVRTALQTRTGTIGGNPRSYQSRRGNQEYRDWRRNKVWGGSPAEYDRIVAEAKRVFEAAKKKSKADAKAAADKYDETLAQIQTDKADYETRKNNAAAWLAKYEENNPENLDTAERLKQAEEHNKINALVVDYLTKKKQKDAAEKVAQTHEKKLSDLLKRAGNPYVRKSELPIAGLTFTDDGWS